MTDLSRCRHCGQQNIKWSKWFQCGPILGWSYHYRVKCKNPNCKKTYSVLHHNYPKVITANQDWQLSKTTRKHIKKMIEDGNLPKFNLPFDVDPLSLLSNNPTNSKFPEPPGLF